MLMLLGIASPPVVLGSGNFATWWARMHWAYLSSGPPPATVVTGWCEDPHAVIAVAHATRASAAWGRLGRLRGEVRGVMVDLNMAVLSVWCGDKWFYEPAGDSAGTMAVTGLLPAVRDARG